MQSRTKLLPVLLAGLLLLAGCTAPVQRAAAGADGAASPDSPTVSVTGVGTVTAAPDRAVIDLAVVSVADSAGAAREDAATRTDRLLAALADAGVPDDAVTTVGYSLVPEYDHRNDSRDVTGYRAVHSLRVEVSPDAAGAVVDTAVGAGDATVSRVGFTLSDEARESLRAEAIDAAVAAARADADAAAGAAELSIAGVETLAVGGSPVAPVSYDASAIDGRETSFRPGPVSVTATVSVTYRVA